MDVASLLTVIAILVACYSVMSEEKRLDIRIRLSWIDYLVVGGLIIGVFVIIYSPLLTPIAIKTGISPIPWLLGFDEDKTTLLFLVLILVYASLRAGSRNLSSAGRLNWCRVSLSCLHAKQYAQLAYLLDRYHQQIFRIVEGQVWYVRVHEFVRPPYYAGILLNGEGLPPPTKEFLIVRRFFYPLRRFLARLFPSRSEHRDELMLSISRLLLKKPFIVYLSDTKPMLAAQATSLTLIDRNQSMGFMFEEWLTDRYSLFSLEIKRSDSSVFCYTQESRSDIQLLRFFLSDLEFATKISVWKPVGDFLLRHARQMQGRDNYYNQPSADYGSGNEEWECPIYMALRFFDVMVTTAIHRGYHYHMWLMYVGYCFDQILQNLDRASDADETDEFPVKFDYLVYECISICSSWVVIEEANDTVRLFVEGGDEAKLNSKSKHMPRWQAALLLGRMLQQLVVSPKFLAGKKAYFLEVVLRNLERLEHNGRTALTNLVLDASVGLDRGDAVDGSALAELSKAYDDVDTFMRHDVPSFHKRLEELRASV